MTKPAPFARVVAEFVVGNDAGDIGAEHLAAAHRSCVDAIGTALAGLRTPHGAMAIDFAAGDGGAGGCSILGTALKAPPAFAAEANATLAHADDFDDMGGYGHPSAALVPALLAAAELRGGVDGTEFLVAFTLGFEVAAGLCRAGYDQYERCFHSTAVFGVLAACCASARLLRLDTDQVTAALTIAASSGCGLGRNSGTMVKPLHAGLAAGNGLLATLLAGAGMGGAEDVFAARGGFCEAYYGRSIDLDAIGRKLGDPFTLADTVAIKKYPCCGSNQSALDGVAQLLEVHRLRYEEIDEIVVHEMSETSPVLRYPNPRDGLEGKFSIQFTVAQLARKGALGVADFDDEEVRAPAAKAAVARVRPEVLSRWNRARAVKQRGNPVTIFTRDGRRLHALARRSELLGSPTRPLDWDALGDKFRRNARWALPDAGAIERALTAWRRLPELDDVRKAIATVTG